MHRVAAGKKIFPPCHKRALPNVIAYRRTSAGAEETGGCAMTGHGKRAPLIGVGLVAIAAAALLFWGAWTQAGPDRSPRSVAGQRLSGPVRPALARFCLTGEKVHATILFKHKGVVGACAA